MSEQYPDYQGEPLKLVEDAHQLSKDSQTVRNEQYSRDYKLWNSFMDVNERDPDRANIFIPKIYSIVETKAPRDTKALLGTRPYIPFDSKRKAFKDIAKIQTAVLDDLLYMGGFFDKSSQCVKMKTLYGTAFVETIPYFETVMQKRLVPEVIMGIPVGVKVIEEPVLRMRLSIRSFAPWEVYVDPHAINLEEKGGCRYVIKAQLVSRGTLIKMAQKGAYPNLDIDKLIFNDDRTKDGITEDWGIKMLSDLGLTMPIGDDDLGILLRYESEDRYIDIWNGQTVLRNGDNHFNHGMINLSRMIHTMSPHTQNVFWGIGEAKPNEILQSMLNDSWNMTFDNHNMNNQGMTYYKKGSVNPDALVRTVGNKIAVDISDDRPIQNAILETNGNPLPQDHYAIPQTVERMMDLGSGSFNIQRGESDNVEKTLGEASMLREAGDLRQELSIRYGEHIYLADVGRKALSHIDQFATPDDIVEIVGESDAAKLFSVNPNDLPGGYNFTFRGSDKVANMLIKQRNLKELTPFIQNSPNASQFKWLDMLLEAHEISQRDIEELLIPDEIAMQLQMAAQQRDFERQVLLQAMGGASKQGQTQGKQATQPEKKKITNTSVEAKEAGNEHNPTRQGV